MTHIAPVVVLIFAGGHVECAEWLLRQGADVNGANCKGVTPLFIACLKGRTAVVSLLLKQPINCNARSTKEKVQKNNTPPTSCM